MQEPISQRTSGKPIIGLDLLRGIAAFAVFLGHVRGSSFVEFGDLPLDQQGILTKVLFGITRTGHEAVLVFFVLSGYLVGGQIINRVREGRFKMIAYALERTTRIFIPLIPACVFTIAISWLVFGQEPNWPQTLLNMFGLNGVLTETLTANAPLWTLAYEIWFYLIAGALGYLFTSAQRAHIAFLVIACGVVVFCVLDARYVLFWMMGGLCTALSGQKRLWLLGMIGCALFIFGVLDYQLASESKSFKNVVYLPVPVAEALIVLGVCSIIPFVCEPKIDAALKILRVPALYLSSISYTLYLFHYPLNVALDNIFPKAANLSWTSIGAFCVKTAIIFLAINVFYLAFEANTAAIRRYLRGHLFAVQKEVE
jgi:peptidoglycan/LPS O-acetylase OafA/YrhL